MVLNLCYVRPMHSLKPRVGKCTVKVSCDHSFYYDMWTALCIRVDGTITIFVHEGSRDVPHLNFPNPAAAGFGRIY